MGKSILYVISGALLATTILGCASFAEAAEIKVIASVAVRPLLDALLPVFTKASGDTVSVEYGTAALVKEKASTGSAFDVAITTPAAVDDLVKAGRVTPATREVVGVAVASLAYRTGTPKPDVSTEEAFKTTLLSAPSISLSDPAQGGASSNYFIATAKRLGINDAIRSKLILTKAGEGAVPVGTGAARYGAALTSEIAAVPGLSSVPLFPDQPGSTTILVATIASNTSQHDAAEKLIAYFLTPQAIEVRKSKGLGGS